MRWGGAVAAGAAATTDVSSAAMIIAGQARAEQLHSVTLSRRPI
jgi:hypothetical protein